MKPNEVINFDKWIPSEPYLQQMTVYASSLRVGYSSKKPTVNLKHIKMVQVYIRIYKQIIIIGIFKTRLKKAI